MKNNWKKDDIQFPRLISELEQAGAFTPQVVEDLLTSMDITNGELDELIDRAKTKFDDIKTTL